MALNYGLQRDEPHYAAAGLLVSNLVGPSLGLPPYAAAFRWPYIRSIIWCEQVCVRSHVRLRLVFEETCASGTSNLSVLLLPPSFLTYVDNSFNN